MRLFIAVNLTQKEKARLHRTVRRLEQLADQGTFSHRDNLHLTLAFLGETDRAADLHRILDAVKGRCFTLECGELGRFSGGDGEIYWLGIQRHPALLELRQTLQKVLKDAGFATDDRPYQPHLTLGRRVHISPAARLVLEQELSPTELQVTRLSLMQSHRIAGRLCYTELYHAQLDTNFKWTERCDRT